MNSSISEKMSNKRLWGGRIISGVPALLLLVDSALMLYKPAAVQLGYPESAIVGMGLAQLVSTLFYVVPRTAILGAILLTGYLGGAVATHVRMGASTFVVIFPAIFGLLIWGGLWLRDNRLRDIIPLREP